jgi:hypothetical protein
MIADIHFIEAIASLCGEFTFFSMLIIVAIKIIWEAL